MALVNMRDMLHHAYRKGYAVGAFDVDSLEFLQGIMTAAEACHSPVILNLVDYHFDNFDLEMIMPAVEAVARHSSVPVAIQLNYATGVSCAVRGINLGCNGIMVEAPYDTPTQNINMARAVVEMAHACGIPVEGELGYVPGVQDKKAQTHPGKIAFTSVTKAREYVEQTGVDFLSVSIGTVHGRMNNEPVLEYRLLDQINQTLNIPLVIHGGSALRDNQFQRLVAGGVAKINCYTALADAAAVPIRDNVKVERGDGYKGLMQGVKNTIAVNVERFMRLSGSVGRATEILEQCEPWTPVEHLIIYNVTGITEQDVNDLMIKGQEMLHTIPGVREVIAGRAVKEDAKYRYTWLVRFCHPCVIDSYREHPKHVAFADQYFRPVASDRISIDYKWVDSHTVRQEDSHKSMNRLIKTATELTY